MEIFFGFLGIILIVSLIKYVQAYGDCKYSEGRLDENTYQLEQWDKLANECLQIIKDKIEDEK